MVVLDRIRYITGFPVEGDRAWWWPVGVLTLLVPTALWLASAGTAQPAEDEQLAEDRKVPALSNDQLEAAGAELLRTFQSTGTRCS